MGENYNKGKLNVPDMVTRSSNSDTQDRPGRLLLDVELSMLKNLNKRRNNIGLNDSLQQ